MTIEVLYEFFKWCSIFNMTILAWWAVWIMAFPGFVYKMHSQWFEMPREQFNLIHYKAITFYKLSIILFNVIPWFVLMKMQL